MDIHPVAGPSGKKLVPALVWRVRLTEIALGRGEAC